MKMYTIQVLDNNTINKYIFRRYERKNEICTKDRNDKCLFHTDEEIDVYLFFCQKKKSNKAPYSINLSSFFTAAPNSQVLFLQQ
jgi:hypothetical protein